MTIKQRLYISFFLILSIIIFIIGVFFYTIYNLNEIYTSQNLRYDQIRRVEQLKEYNHTFTTIVFDMISNKEKENVIQDRLNKADLVFKRLMQQKHKTLKNSESKLEKENLQLIFSSFESMSFLINQELYELVLHAPKHKSLAPINQRFEALHAQTEKLILEEINILQKRLDETELNREQFIDTIKIELVILLILAFTFSLLISSKIIKIIQGKLYKLNQGVLQLFKDDENSIKVNIGENNELTEITNNLNSYLEKQADIIHSREELLRNISHELKTPITKGKFLVEQLKKTSNNEQIQGINEVLVDIEELTSKLLQREKLNFATLNHTKFKASSLILKALSKLSIEDESMVDLVVEDDFDIEGDKYYLTLALKNLIDNALKYSEELPIRIHAKEKQLYIDNISQALSNDLIYYIQPFTREPNQQLGHGLGLNIVNKILEMHQFKLNYVYQKPYNRFYIHFEQACL